MKDIRIIVVGTYGKEINAGNGQLNKVRDYYRYIGLRYGYETSVRKVDIGEYKTKPIYTLLTLLRSINWCNKIVLLLCGDGYGIRLLFPFIIKLAKIKKRPILFSVIGGGMINDIDKKKRLLNIMKDVEAVFVETQTMKKELEKRGLVNIHYAPVFSNRKTLTIDDLSKKYEEPLRMCTYARVIKEKGIGDAIDAVMEVNERFGRKVCILDIYGEPTKEYEKEFLEKKEIAGECVVCNPLLDDENAIAELSKHFLLLFPTYYEGEGFPIALIESMKAGLPIVATNWHFNSEIVDDGRTGVIYERKGKEKLSDIICRLIDNKDLVNAMRLACIREAEKYKPDAILSELYNMLES